MGAHNDFDARLLSNGLSDLSGIPADRLRRYRFYHAGAEEDHLSASSHHLCCLTDGISSRAASTGHHPYDLDLFVGIPGEASGLLSYRPETRCSRADPHGGFTSDESRFDQLHHLAIENTHSFDQHIVIIIPNSLPPGEGILRPMFKLKASTNENFHRAF